MPVAPSTGAPTRTASRLAPLRRRLGMGLLCAAGLLGCVDTSDPLLREPIVLIESDALARFLDRASRLEGTPMARLASRWRREIADCTTVWGHLASATVEAGAAGGGDGIEELGCLESDSTDPALRALAITRRGEHAGWIQWPLGEDGRLELSIDIDPDDDLHVTGWIEPPGEQGALALLLPGREPAAPPAIQSAQTLLHARMHPVGGFRLSSLIPAGSQADRLFALKGRLLEGALLSGTWEIAFMPPAPGGSLPLAVGAVHHRLEAPIRQAVDEALDQLERTWPIRRTARTFQTADGNPVEGGCFLDLPLLPELAPCWTVTPTALLVGYRSEALEAALAPPHVASGPETIDPSDAEPLRSGIDVDFDRLRAVDRVLVSDASRPRPSDLWTRFELRLAGVDSGRIDLHARLEARP